MELQLLMSSNKASTSICYTSLALLCAKEMQQLLIQSSVQIRPHICLHAKHAMKVLEFLRKTPLALVETNLTTALVTNLIRHPRCVFSQYNQITSHWRLYISIWKKIQQTLQVCSTSWAAICPYKIPWSLQKCHNCVREEHIPSQCNKHVQTSKVHKTTMNCLWNNPKTDFKAWMLRLPLHNMRLK